MGEILQKSIIQYQRCCINYFLETDDGKRLENKKQLLNSPETKKLTCYRSHSAENFCFLHYIKIHS